MKLEHYSDLQGFFNEYFAEFEYDCSAGDFLKLPNFEIRPKEYLKFAEIELNNNETRCKINCISHLKRALDCSLDTFLYVYKLYDVMDKKNLKIEKKLDLIRSIGLVSPHSLVKLNLMRNKLEHDYNIPKVEDLETYYDVVSSFVSILESKMILTLNSDMQYGIHGMDNEHIGSFSIEYQFDQPPSIKTEIHMFKNEEDYQLTINVNEDYKEFLRFFKTLFLLINEYTGLKSRTEILKEINAPFDT